MKKIPFLFLVFAITLIGGCKEDNPEPDLDPIMNDEYVYDGGATLLKWGGYCDNTNLIAGIVTGTYSLGVSATIVHSGEALKNQPVIFRFEIPVELIDTKIDLSICRTVFPNSIGWRFYFRNEFVEYNWKEENREFNGILEGNLIISRQVGTEIFTIEFNVKTINGNVLKGQYNDLFINADNETIDLSLSS